jgi:hypothetical protein
MSATTGKFSGITSNLNTSYFGSTGQAHFDSSGNLFITSLSGTTLNFNTLTITNPVTLVGLTNTALTPSRIVMTGANTNEVSAAASGAVPIDADGSATTAGQLTNVLANTLNGAQIQGTVPLATSASAVTYSTNLSTMAPDFNKTYSTITTNAAFTFLAPLNVSSTLAQTAVIWVTNSTAAAVVVTAPANVHTQGTWYVTNSTIFTFFNYPPFLTNAIALPLW